MAYKKAKKVLLVSPYSSKTVGGIGTWSRIVLDYANEHGDCEVIFLNTVQGLPKRWSLNNRLAHVTIGLLDSLLIIIRLTWRMMITMPEVVHYTSSAASALYKDRIALWVVKKLFKKKFIIHWHFGRIPAIFEEKGREYNLFRRVSANVDLSIVIDKRSYDVLSSEGLKATYIPNPIPTALQYEAERIELDEAAIARNEGEVLFVGHVLDTKGIKELIHACCGSTLVKKLIVVGPFFDENLKEEVIEIATQRDNGNWLELVGEKNREVVWNYYKKCSLFCLPSYTEGFPYVILEAMAFACPIIATTVGAIPEMLSEDCGVLVEPKMIDPLKGSLEKLLQDTNRMRIMGEKAHARVLGEYTIDRVFSKYEQYWKTI